MLSKKLLIVIILLLLSSASYIFLKDTKKLEIKSIDIDSKLIEVVEENINDIKDEAGSRLIGDPPERREKVEIKENITESEPVEPENKEDNKEENKKEEEKAQAPSISQKLVSWGYQSASGRKIDVIIIHSSYDALGSDPYDTDGLVKEYKQYGVAAHYLINRKGKIYQLVRDKNIAYHAGTSSVPDGRSNVNNFSIGIELMNMKDSQFTSAQYASLNNLIDYLKSSYNIKYTLGHDQIAPGRKTDPWNFDWNELWN